MTRYPITRELASEPDGAVFEAVTVEGTSRYYPTLELAEAARMPGSHAPLNILPEPRRLYRVRIA